MIDRLKKLMNRETLLYLIFGAATTVVNYVVFFLIYNVAFDNAHSLLANGIAFAEAVVFAFVVNKMYVFESKSWDMESLKKEVPSFLAARVGSFALEEAGLFVAEHLLGLGRVVLFTFAGSEIDGITATKIALAVIVVLINYVLCKWFVFKK